ncbi:carbon-nitrogen hydrolase family protein [Reinekea sp.]|jgi:predicted amidohydrolase|uniref:carbon-nitrogen hydrolase family protein n=1 Tax=Reinekea sp. TaxID=1970455 RepID=UPI003988DD4C
MKLFLVQMTSVKDVQLNLAVVKNFARQAEAAGCDLLILPEMFSQFGVSNNRELAGLEAEFNGPVGKAIRQLAIEHGLWIVAGTVPVDAGDGQNPKARCHVINTEGEVVTCYDKIHLFDADVGDKQGQYKESDSYSHGDAPVVFDSPWGTLGLAVCYDLRFPEVFRQLNDLGAELVFLPSAFTYKTGQLHWDTLLRARAIENGFFVAGVNQTGQHDAKRQTWGRTQLVHPQGQVESLIDEVAGLVVDVDLSEVKEFRVALPVNKHRRLS